MGKMEFTAEIKAGPRGGAFVTVPFDVESVFGKKRVPVVANFDGVEYRGSIVRMGSPDFIIGIRKDIRSHIGKDIGDVVKVVVREDVEERIVVIPDDLESAFLEQPEARRIFLGMSYSHQREYVEAITEAKKEETRKRRVGKTIAALLKIG